MTVDFSSLYAYNEVSIQIHDYWFHLSRNSNATLWQNIAQLSGNPAQKNIKEIDIKELVKACQGKRCKELENQLENYNKNKDYIKRIIAVEEPFSIPKEDMIS